jgi:hypothetical protein
MPMIPWLRSSVQPHVLLALLGLPVRLVAAAHSATAPSYCIPARSTAVRYRAQAGAPRRAVVAHIAASGLGYARDLRCSRSAMESSDRASSAKAPLAA